MTGRGAQEAEIAVPAGWDRAAWTWLLVILVIAATLTFIGLGGGAMRPYDEGLYGKLARNALTHHEYLYAVDQDGTLYEPYGKPPLTIILVAGSFRLLGISLLSLRVPFAMAMVASIGVAFAWGRRIGGVPVAVGWAGALMFCAASARWGRAACIEPMLTLWLLTGLWAYHEAMLRRGLRALGWSLVCGLSLALAVATKQVLVGLAIVPIVALELWRWRGREALRRLVPALGVPAAFAAVWLGAAVATLGDQAIEIYVRFEVLRRLEGYRSGLVQRSLNELSGVVAEACDPFPWVLGVAGLVVLVLMRPVVRRQADGSLLLPLWLVTTVAVFENLSGSMLPWYAHNLVVPLCGGVGFLVAGLWGPTTRRLEVVRAVGGALTLAVGAVGALALVVSQLDVALLIGLVFVVAWRRGSLGHPRFVTAMAGLAGLAFIGGAAVHPRLRTPAQAHEQLMERLAQRGIERVDVDANTGLTTENEWGTYYGSGGRKVTRPPWSARSGAQAYVTATIWPQEFVPANGSEVMYGPGLMVLLDHLERPPWSPRSVVELLERGPLTFEAEHLPSQRDDTEVIDPQAAGGRARAVVHTPGIERSAFVLGHGPGLTLPDGKYAVDFSLRWVCGSVDRRAVATLQVVAGRKVVRQQAVECSGEDPQGYQTISLDVRLTKPARVELWVRYQWGELWYDRVVVRRVASPSG